MFARSLSNTFSSHLLACLTCVSHLLPKPPLAPSLCATQAMSIRLREDIYGGPQDDLLRFWLSIDIPRQLVRSTKNTALDLKHTQHHDCSSLHALVLLLFLLGFIV